MLLKIIFGLSQNFYITSSQQNIVHIEARRANPEVVRQTNMIIITPLKTNNKNYYIKLLKPNSKNLLKSINENFKYTNYIFP